MMGTKGKPGMDVKTVSNVMMLAAKDLSTANISQILGVSETTVKRIKRCVKEFEVGILNGWEYAYSHPHELARAKMVAQYMGLPEMTKEELEWETATDTDDGWAQMETLIENCNSQSEINKLLADLVDMLDRLLAECIKIRKALE